MSLRDDEELADQLPPELKRTVERLDEQLARLRAARSKMASREVSPRKTGRGGQYESGTEDSGLDLDDAGDPYEEEVEAPYASRTQRPTSGGVNNVGYSRRGDDPYGSESHASYRDGESTEEERYRRPASAAARGRRYASEEEEREMAVVARADRAADIHRRRDPSRYDDGRESSSAAEYSSYDRPPLDSWQRAGLDSQRQPELQTSRAREWGAMIRQRVTKTPPISQPNSHNASREAAARPEAAAAQWRPNSDAGAKEDGNRVAEISRLRVEVEELKAEAVKTRSSNDAATETRLTLMREDTERRVAQAYQDGMASTAGRRDELIARADRLASELDAAQALTKEQKARIDKQNADLAKLRERNTQVQSSANDAISTIRRQDVELAQLREQLRSAEESRAKLEVSNKEMTKALEPLKARAMKRDSALAEKEEQLTEERHRREELEQRYTTHVENVRGDIEAAQREMGAFMENAARSEERLLQDNKALRTRYAKAKTRLEENKTLLQEAHTQLAQLVTDRDAMHAAKTSEVHDLQATLEETKVKLHNVEESAHRAAREWDLEKQELVAEHTRRAAEAAKDLQVATKELAELQGETIGLGSRLDGERAVVGNLNEEIASLQRSNREYRVRLEEATASADVKANEITDLRRVVRDRDEANAALRGELGRAKDAKERAELELQGLKTKLRTSSAQLVNQSVNRTAGSQASASDSAGGRRSWRSAGRRGVTSSGDDSSSAHNHGERVITHRSPTRRGATRNVDVVDTREPLHEEFQRGIERASANAGPGVLAESSVVQEADAAVMKIMQALSQQTQELRAAAQHVADVEPLTPSDEDD